MGAETETLEIINDAEERMLMPANIEVTEPIGVGFGAITAPEMTQEEALAEAHEVATFRRRIDWRNPAVCIDGRTLAEGLALPLGAHLAGAAETLFVGAKAAGLQLAGAELLAKAKEKGFTLGAHGDSTNKAQGFKNGTGCGANDKVEVISDLHGKHKDALAGTSQALMGSDYDEATYQATELSVPSDDKNFLRNTVGEELTEILLDDNEGVHGHREQMVIFNYQEDTTIDRDAYFKATGKQVFVVDVWYIRQLAEAMAEGDKSVMSRLYHAMISYQVATYIGLCDGTHRAAVMQQQELASVN